MREGLEKGVAPQMLDDFIMNNSYDAFDTEFEEAMDAWEAYCEELAQEDADLKN